MFLKLFHIYSVFTLLFSLYHYFNERPMIIVNLPVTQVFLWLFGCCKLFLQDEFFFNQWSSLYDLSKYRSSVILSIHFKNIVLVVVFFHSINITISDLIFSQASFLPLLWKIHFIYLSKKSSKVYWSKWLFDIAVSTLMSNTFCSFVCCHQA